MSNFFSTWKPALGFVVGGFVGLVLGFGFGIGWGLLSQWLAPNDPSAGAVAIMAIFTTPFGGLVGSIIGTIIGYRLKARTNRQAKAVRSSSKTHSA